MPAMVPWRATEEGDVTDAVVEWYERFAYGKPGALVVEATGIRDIPSGPLLRISHNRYTDGLRRIVDAVKKASGGETKLFIQLIDFLSIRRRPSREKFFSQFLKITNQHRQALNLTEADDDAIRSRLLELADQDLAAILTEREHENYSKGYRERVTDVELPHILGLPETLPGLFASAATRAKNAGFDGIELHYAHAYTMASFLSKRNTRSDNYGGSRTNRLRLPLKVYDAVREAVGSNYVVGCRMLTEDCVEGGSKLDDSVFFARGLATAGMDFISLSRGGKFEDAARPAVGQAVYPYTGKSGYECMPHFISDDAGPFGRNAEPSKKIRQAIADTGCGVPVVLAGGIHSFDQAENFLQDGTADIIALARQSLADPDWFEKVRSGNGGKVNTCKYTNYCEGLDQKHKTVTCQLWDRKQLDEAGVQLTEDGKRRLTAPRWHLHRQES